VPDGKSITLNDPRNWQATAPKDIRYIGGGIGDRTPAG
jgi:hypothetical protein